MTHSISLELSGTPKQCARRSVLAMISVLAALIFGWAATARADDHDDGVVRIMTQNVYEGTNFTELLAAATPPLFFAAVTTTRQNILATKPAVRAAAVAREIARELPDLVALQEAAILGSALVPVSTSAPPTPVTTVEEDQLALVLAELERLGHPYHAIAILPNLDAQAPSSLGPSVRITVRAAILVRSDRNDIRLSNTQVREFLDLSALATPIGVSIPNLRGWASVDVKVNGREFRFITTHLDQTPFFNLLQINEVLPAAVDSTTLPIVFVGDFNVVANIPTHPTFANYQRLINSGLVDAWQQKRAPDPGLNCCQNPDVMNVTSNFTLRVDLVLLRGGIDVRDIHLVGDNQSDRVEGVWPSDHAGVVATLRIPQSQDSHH